MQELVEGIAQGMDHPARIALIHRWLGLRGLGGGVDRPSDLFPSVRLSPGSRSRVRVIGARALADCGRDGDAEHPDGVQADVVRMRESAVFRGQARELVVW